MTVEGLGSHIGSPFDCKKCFWLTCLQIVVVCSSLCKWPINILLTTCPTGIVSESSYIFYDFNISFGIILIYYGKYINSGLFVVIKENYLCIGGGPMWVCSRISLELKIVSLYRCCSRYLQFCLQFWNQPFGLLYLESKKSLMPCYLEGCATGLVSRYIYIYIYTLQKYTICLV